MRAEVSPPQFSNSTSERKFPEGIPSGPTEGASKEEQYEVTLSEKPDHQACSEKGVENWVGKLQ
jgi:hypothetical protein